MSQDPAADAFFASTLRYIQFQKQKGGALAEKYESIKVWLAEFYPTEVPLSCNSSRQGNIFLSFFLLDWGSKLYFVLLTLPSPSDIRWLLFPSVGSSILVQCNLDYRYFVKGKHIVLRVLLIPLSHIYCFGN